MSNKVFHTNQEPYYDDFDPKDNYVGVLFTPGRPVQVRELNQLQSIQQHQRSRFSEHIFKHGSIVNGQSVCRMDSPFCTVEDFFYEPGTTDATENRVFVDYLKNKKLVGRTSEIEAKIIIGVEASGSRPTTLYLNYTRSGADKKTVRFIPGEFIDVVGFDDEVVFSLKMRCPECDETQGSIPPTGKGTLWSIPDATYYVHGYFVDFEHTIVVGEQFSTSLDTYHLVLEISADIITHQDDDSLYDNTLGYPNYSAPGADRARVRLIPKVIYDFDESDSRITLVRVSKGTISYLKNKSEYSDIMKMIAERTYDESGNYTVVPFRANFLEHLKRGENGGVYTESEGGDESKFIASLSKGKAYVKGYEVETISESFVEFEKARDTKVNRGHYTQFSELSYILIKPIAESFFIPNDLAQNSIYGNLKANMYDGPVTVDKLHSGTHKGTITPFSVQFYETDSSDGLPVYKMYFTEINMNTSGGAAAKFTHVRSIAYYGTITFLANVVLDPLTGEPKIYNNNETPLIWKIREGVKTTRDADNNDIRSLTYSCMEKFRCVLDGNGTYKFIANSGSYFEAFNPTTTLAAFVNSNGQCTKITFTNQIAITPDAINLNFGSVNGGKTVVLFHSVVKSGAIEKKKTILETVDENLPIDPVTLNVQLSKSDVVEVLEVLDNSGLQVDYESFDNGQRDYAYVNASVKLPNGSSGTYSVRYRYFEHGPGEFFTIDSYRDLLSSEDNDFYRVNIPVYKSKAGVSYRLADCIDFRPLILEGDTSVKIEQPKLQGLLISDVEFYLPRIDYLAADRYGQIKQLKGISSEQPTPPKLPADGSIMALYEIHQNPYVYDLRKDVKKKFIENKRYTMRDIGRLEQRLKNVEYYTTLSLMELTLAQTSVTDEFGFDRFKNGFLADNFQNFQASNISDPEFKACLDRKDAVLRPPYVFFNSDYEVDKNSSENFIFINDSVAMFDYDHEVMFEQVYATKHLSVNPYFIWEKVGTIVMDPPYDNWCDVNTKPGVVADLELFPEEADWDNVAGAAFGDWEFANTTATDLGTYMTDASLKTYMRSIPVKFYATGMRPNTVVYPFFDERDVGANCRPLTNNSSYGDELVTDGSGSLAGEFLIPRDTFFTGQLTFMLSNDPGLTDDEDMRLTSAKGIFWSGGLNIEKQNITLNVIQPFIPPPWPKMPECFESLKDALVHFQLPEPFHPNAETYVKDPARRAFFAGHFHAAIDSARAAGIGIWVGHNTPGPVASAVIRDYAKRIEHETDIPDLTFCNGLSRDPVAQSFLADESCFITGVDVFFHTVDETDSGLFVSIVTMNTGYPTQTTLAEVKLNPSKILTSEDGTVATNVKFPYPVYVQKDEEYAIVVGGTTPDSRVFACKLGDEDYSTGKTVETQPLMGSLFKSQNASTWTPYQFEDLTIRVYRARFKYDTGTLVLKNKPFSDNRLVFNPFETQAGSNQIRVWCDNHAMRPGNTFKANFADEYWISLSSTVSIGQRLVTETGYGFVRKVVRGDGSECQVALSGITGLFSAGQTFRAESLEIDHNEFIVNGVFDIKPPEGTVTEKTGEIIDITSSTSDLNGIPVHKLNRVLTVKAVDSINSFIIEVDQMATETGRVGGDVFLNVSRRYDAFTNHGSFMEYDSSSEWTFDGTGHSLNGLFEDQDGVISENIEFEFGKLRTLERPLKYLNTGDSIGLVGSFTSSSTLMSPVIDVGSFTFIGVGNVVDWNTEEVYNVPPNSVNRLVPETDPVNGSSVYKYVTRTINLAEPAFDIRFFLDVHKPEYTDFDIFIKMREPTDSTEMNELPWVKIEDVWKDFTCDVGEYREIDVQFSEKMPIVFDGTTSFTSFKIKVVGRAKNTSKPPHFQLLRLIAVT